MKRQTIDHSTAYCKCRGGKGPWHIKILVKQRRTRVVTSLNIAYTESAFRLLEETQALNSQHYCTTHHQETECFYTPEFGYHYAPRPTTRYIRTVVQSAK
jgi:hypothetical protein